MRENECKVIRKSLKLQVISSVFVNFSNFFGFVIHSKKVNQYVDNLEIGLSVQKINI